MTEYLLLGGVVLGATLLVIAFMYGVFRWAMITKVMLIIMPMICFMIIMSYWIGTQGVSALTALIGSTLGVSSYVIVFLIINKEIFKPFTEQAKQIEEEGKYLSVHIGRIAATVEAIARDGDLSGDLAKEREDDVGILVDSVNVMLGALMEYTVMAESIASGDLTVRVDPKSERDLLGNAFAEMLNSLKSAVTRLSMSSKELDMASYRLAETAKQAGGATSQVANASQEIAKGAGDQARHAQDTTKSVEQLSGVIFNISKGAEAQADGVMKASSSISDMSVAIELLSENAAAAAEGSQKAAKAAGEGVSVTQETVDGMKEIMSTVEVVGGKVMELGQRSIEIGKIIGVIEDIAAQTNLLALNAAIEAARAGEQGRGFAVVSDEVRKLAERTASATKEIAELIGNVQNGVASAVRAMEEGTGQVQEGYRLASEAGEALEEIQKASNVVSGQIEQITTRADQVGSCTSELVRIIDSVSAVTEQNSAATGDMSASASQVSMSVNVVTGVIEENTAAAEEVSASAEEMNAEVIEIVASADMLREMADNLQSLVSRFVLESMDDDLAGLITPASDSGDLDSSLGGCSELQDGSVAVLSDKGNGRKRSQGRRKDSILRRRSA
ncbi:MAG: HAMP domain-containing methyl-accepting chemotaxis protein [Chloroflexota bacterium]|nr:HAMP domain-containing methyl-accepting chemotaxis protein [Chloroflexota bacterium]